MQPLIDYDEAVKLAASELVRFSMGSDPRSGFEVERSKAGVVEAVLAGVYGVDPGCVSSDLDARGRAVAESLGGSWRT